MNDCVLRYDWRMTLSRSSRSVVAVLAAIVMLLCQAAALAQACVTNQVERSDVTVAVSPCHGASEADSTSGHQPAVPSTCEASQALAQADSVTIYPPADLAPLVVVAVDTASAARGFRSQQQALHNVCSSPPLAILHCRFLI